MEYPNNTSLIGVHSPFPGIQDQLRLEKSISVQNGPPSIEKKVNPFRSNQKLSKKDRHQHLTLKEIIINGKSSLPESRQLFSSLTVTPKFIIRLCMKQIIENIYHVGDNECSVYMVDTRSDQGLTLIDAGMNLDMIRQISSYGLPFENIQHCILTHCHIDHIGICAQLSRELPDIKFYAHELDAEPIEESGHDERTAASWYGVRYEPVKLYQKFYSDTVIKLGGCEFQCIHTPGHTPGSISVLVESQGKKVLFGQDLHGPFSKSFLSDLQDYQRSMQKLLDLESDILCEGHFGIFQPGDQVRQYIEKYKYQNQP